MLRNQYSTSLWSCILRYTAQTASPKDPTLYLEIGANRVEGAQSILDYISRPLKFFRGRDTDIDRGLSAEQRALSRSVTALLEDRFMAFHRNPTQ